MANITRKVLSEKYNIIGENKDIVLYRKKEDIHYSNRGLGYCGNVQLVNGKVIFNGKKYSDIDSLDNALIEWENSLEFPIDTYNPMMREGAKLYSKIDWFLCEKMGFKTKVINWESYYIKSFGIDFALKFTLKNSYEDESVNITCSFGGIHFTQNFTDVNEGIALISTITQNCVLSMAKDVVDALAVIPKERTTEIETFVNSNKNIFGIEKVSFKDLMINMLERELKALKES